MTDSFEDEGLFASTEVSIAHLRALLVQDLEPFLPQPGEKLIRLSVVWTNALLHRTTDLASAAISLFRERRLVPGCVLTRSLYETAAQLYYFQKKLSVAIETEQLKEITDHVVRGAWGSKDGSTKHEAIQILTAVHHLDREFKGFESEYFHLCEYAHPNMKGGLGTYSRIGIQDYEVAFGTNPQGLKMGPFGLGGLDIALRIIKELLERHSKIESSFREVVYRKAPTLFID